MDEVNHNQIEVTEGAGDMADNTSDITQNQENSVISQPQIIIPDERQIKDAVGWFNKMQLKQRRAIQFYQVFGTSEETGLKVAESSELATGN